MLGNNRKTRVQKANGFIKNDQMTSKVKKTSKSGHKKLIKAA